MALYFWGKKNLKRQRGMAASGHAGAAGARSAPAVPAALQEAVALAGSRNRAAIATLEQCRSRCRESQSFLFLFPPPLFSGRPNPNHCPCARVGSEHEGVFPELEGNCSWLCVCSSKPLGTPK